MDISDILSIGGVSTGMVSCIMIIYKVLRGINNKRFHSSCCGKDLDVVIAVNEVTEEEKKPHSEHHETKKDEKEETKDEA